MSPRASLILIGIAFLFILLPFLFWQAVWFGRPITDAEMSRSLSLDAEPRKTQHALVQVSERINRRDPAVKQWYPQVVALAGHKDSQLRLTTAWVMGQDNTAPEFHHALLKLVGDSDPMVRSNAALALVRFADPAGRPQLVAMLQPFTMQSPVAGRLSTRLKPEDVVRPGTLVGRIETGAGKTEVRAPVSGRLERWLAADGAPIAAGQPLCLLAPGDDMAWEALRGLYLVGQAEDIPAIEAFVKNSRDTLSALQKQARLTLQAIRSRSGS
jgi:biotin carboxyl carrier protein